MTLPHTLIKRTMLSEYLTELEFIFNEKQIVMKRNEKIVDIEKLTSSFEVVHVDLHVDLGLGFIFTVMLQSPNYILASADYIKDMFREYTVEY
ncbi:hypothetical protein [Anaerosporobacter sp.]|uniref:hypothetical protein n=1 Tax=Anaerosporobacter sp. TaxID=1872529 RepID=UPI00286F8541|nr:hypothetical protein [Anaerosporobacter sp.]